MLYQEQVQEKVKIDPKNLGRLREMLYQRSGISVAEGKEYLFENRLANRLKEHNCRDFEEYYYLLKYRPEGPREMARMIECMTTNETSFFREIAHLRIFEQTVIPQVVEEKAKSGQGTIRIWSAACSTGEEPYTLAILMQEMKQSLAGMRVEILASDINESVIQAARRGAYGENTLRNVPAEILQKYFVRDGSGVQIQESLKSVIRFANLNLIEKHRLRLAYGMDVIFCKNVLIYFDVKAKKQVLQSLYDALHPGGYLFISQAESLHDLSRAFKPIYGAQGVVYRKE